MIYSTNICEIKNNMKFKSIEIENFGPYFGLNKINLETNSNSPVILVHGENERGKTETASCISLVFIWTHQGSFKSIRKRNEFC